VFVTGNSGFPKSHDISKAIDRAEGAERERVECNGGGRMGGGDYESTDYSDGWHGPTSNNPITQDAERFDGYGTALAPAHEPIGLWRAPCDKTYAECAVEDGSGCLNIDGARVPTEDSLDGGTYSDGASQEVDAQVPGNGIKRDFEQPDGRWPSNIVLTHHPDCGETCREGCPVREMDRQSGVSKSSVRVSEDNGKQGATYGLDREGVTPRGHNDSGGASRFFPRFRYNAKASRAEREAGLYREPECVDDGRDEPIDNAYQRGKTERRNTHPCVKPVELVRWIAALLLPPERETPRRILVPFAGSGSEMIACMLAGWDEVVGIEKSAEYASLARERLEWWQEHGEDAVEVDKAHRKRREQESETGQASLTDFLNDGG